MSTHSHHIVHRQTLIKSDNNKLGMSLTCASASTLGQLRLSSLLHLCSQQQQNKSTVRFVRFAAEKTESWIQEQRVSSCCRCHRRRRNWFLVVTPPQPLAPQHADLHLCVHRRHGQERNCTQRSRPSFAAQWSVTGICECRKRVSLNLWRKLCALATCCYLHSSVGRF